MKVSLILTVHDRPAEVSAQVGNSLAGQPIDEAILVLDRPTDDARFGAMLGYSHFGEKLKAVALEGQPGWRSPVTAWNAGFKAATGDILYCISSETVQAPGNIARAVEMLENRNAVVFGRCECSCGPAGTEVNWGGTAPGNLFTDANHPRPLGFIMALPRQAMAKVGGMDEKFKDGLWYDDDDLMFRLWRDAKCDFIFDDGISGVHLHHERPGLDQAKIAVNQRVMMLKHGSLRPLSLESRHVSWKPGKTEWRHP